ncbi:hypothetical protein EI94DRAFT_127631 [Lactarius quietus]|nr:hypothetical protein EI94DRAFT_127631 [Lactarius quietus]
MSLPRSDSVESICTVLTCASEEYDDLFAKQSLSTEVLSDDALRNIIRPNSERLRAADCRYRLDDFLNAILMHAPHPLGRRYVAICLHIAHEKGEDGVVNAAKAWLDNLLLPMLAISRRKKTEPASSQTPTIDTTMEHIESANRNDQQALRHAVSHASVFLLLSTKFISGCPSRTVFLCDHEGIRRCSGRQTLTGRSL